MDKFWERLVDASYDPGAEDVKVEIPVGGWTEPYKGSVGERILMLGGG